MVIRVHTGRRGYTTTILGPEALAAIARVNSLALTGTVLIKHPDAIGAYNETTHQHDRTPGASVYTGPCRLVQTGQSREPAAVGGELITVTSYRLDLPDLPAATVLDDSLVVRLTDVAGPTEASGYGVVGRDLHITAIPVTSNPVGRSLTLVDIQ